MNVSCAVDRIDARCRLPHEIEALFRRKRDLFGEQGVEQHALQKLLHDEGPTIRGNAPIEGFDNVGPHDERPDLPFARLAQPLVTALDWIDLLRIEHLEPHDGPRGVVARLVEIRHRAGDAVVQQFIAAQEIDSRPAAATAKQRKKIGKTHAGKHTTGRGCRQRELTAGRTTTPGMPAYCKKGQKSRLSTDSTRRAVM